ncbi:MAG: hypothetical protein DRI36_02565 [Caldiserica bacterium]|nr:MAG: hypothetical protein DRI36_02565 [Caldisericota bacterium]
MRIISVFILTAILFIFQLNIFSKVYFFGKLPNPNEYFLFATSGWTGNWYIGPDHCWIQKIVIDKEIDFDRIFIGAKIGRAKRDEEILNSFKYSDKKFELRKKERLYKKKKDESLKEEIERLKKELKEIESRVVGKNKDIYISITDDPEKWNNKYLLERNSLLPLEGSYVEAIDGVGEARWFWVEISKDFVVGKSTFYVAVWSDYQEFDSVERSPILAAGWGDDRRDSFLCKIKDGMPDFSTKKDISFFEPAIGIKLIKSENRTLDIVIEKVEYEVDRELKGKFKLRVYFDVKGEEITRFYVERRVDKGFDVFGFYYYNPPYIVTVKNVEKGKYFIRGVVEDWEGNRKVSFVMEVEIK